MSSDLLQPITHKLEALNIKQTPRLLLVSIADQKLELLDNGVLRRTYAISTSANPPSCIENSFGTPTGLHRVAQKIGDGAALGAIFKGRLDTGQTYRELPDSDSEPNLITTRILWLEGLEPGHNQGEGRDSFQRYIYFHGTNHEENIGQPASGGCILLRNSEMIELFDNVQPGDLVLIQ